MKLLEVLGHDVPQEQDFAHANQVPKNAATATGPDRATRAAASAVARPPPEGIDLSRARVLLVLIAASRSNVKRKAMPCDALSASAAPHDHWHGNLDVVSRLPVPA